MKRIARVFPRRTKATPVDVLAFCGYPDLLAIDVDEVHVSVAFTWDLKLAEKLAKAWAHIAPTAIGGPAMRLMSHEFVPGRYLKPGYVITSRGCPNNCWFCHVNRREGDIRELPITDGWNVLDDNILATSERHFECVCEMLSRQSHRAVFTGGLEAARLTAWHVEKLASLRPRPDRFYFAYDSPEDLEPLIVAGRMMQEAGFTRDHHLCCYVLVGYPPDTFDKAIQRIREAWEAGFLPYAMLYRGADGKVDPIWADFQRINLRHAIVRARLESRR